MNCPVCGQVMDDMGGQPFEDREGVFFWLFHCRLCEQVDVVRTVLEARGFREETDWLAQPEQSVPLFRQFKAVFPEDSPPPDDLNKIPF